MRLAQTVKSASFRLAFAYVLLFATSFGVLAAITYVSVTAELSREFHTRILTEAKALQSDFNNRGVGQLLRAISERQRGHLVDGLDYSLVDASGKHLFGTMPVVACKPGWTTLIGPPDGDEDPGEMEELGVYVTPLANGMCLFVGNDWGETQRFGRLILQTFGWVFLLSLTLAVAGGLLLSAAFLKRIEIIRHTAEAIIKGDMRRRIPRRKAPDELDKLASTLNQMLDRTTGLMDSLKQLSNNIAHDLRTPLGRVQRILDGARQDGLSEAEYRQAVERSADGVQSILDMFGAILRISQIETGNRRRGFRKLDLSELITETCEAFAPAFEEDGKALDCDVSPGIQVYGDPELLVLSISNLLENANLHAPASAKVRVSVRKVGSLVEMAVCDNGNGVPAPLRGKIFERFFRVDVSRTTSGNGLGLSIVAAVADLHAGRVFAEDNKPGLRIGMQLSLA